MSLLDSVGDFGASVYDQLLDTGHEMRNWFDPSGNDTPLSFASDPILSSSGDNFVPLENLTLDTESNWLTGPDGAELAAAVVQTSRGNLFGPHKPAALEFSLNGVNEGASSMQPVVSRYDGFDVMRHAVLYDEHNFDLSESAHAAAAGIRSRLIEVPTSTPLVFDAFSMGTRLALGTLVELNQGGWLNRPTTVNLYAGITLGVESANWTWLTPWLSGWVTNRAYESMGSRSDYQDFIHNGAVELAKNPNIHFVNIDGSADEDIPGIEPGQDLIRQTLHADVYTLPNATHSTLRPDAAQSQLPLLPAYLQRLPTLGR